MKTASLLLVSLFCLYISGNAQTKPVEKVVIKTPTVLCDVCKEQVEFTLSHEYGVSSVVVNTYKKTTTIVYLTDRTNISKLRVAIANIGFDADDVEAEETAFKQLSKACKLHKTPAKPPVPVKE